MYINNHPKRGSIIKVEPIRTQAAIDAIKELLAEKPRDLAIFVTGINTNLRASDLLRITVGQVRVLKPGDCFVLREKKTGKPRSITINNAVYVVIHGLLSHREGVKDRDYLFESRKGKGPISVPYLNSLVKSWCRAVGLEGNYGSHTLRKSFGYIHRTVFNTDLPTLMTMYNHSSQRQTLTYLCIQPNEIKDAYMRGI